MSDDKQLDAFGVDHQQLLARLEQLPEDQHAQVQAALPAMLQSLMALFTDELERQQVPAPARLAARLVAAQAAYFGGMQLYLPRNDRLRKALRDIEIYDEFNGVNHRQLARRYDLTEITIYQIVAEQRAAEKARRQLGLF